MATKKSNNTPDTVTLKVKGTIKYFGKSSGKYAREGFSQISYVPADAESLRTDLKTCYEASGTDEKWLPEFVTGKVDHLNLKSKFEIPVLVYDGQNGLETNVLDFVSEYGTPKKGTRVTVCVKFKNGALYPTAVKFADDLKDIETYSLANLFED